MMAMNKELLGMQQGEEEIYAIEALVFSVQVALQKAMNRKGVTNRQLAERLGMTPARVSQVFSSSGPNLTLKTIARIACALEEDFELIRKEDIKSQAPSGDEATRYKSVILHDNTRIAQSAWREQAANSTDLPTVFDLAA